MKRKVAILLITVMSIELTSCGIGGKDVKDLDLVSPLTKQEALDFYAESLKYDDVISRNTDDVEDIASSYIEYSVDNETADTIEEYYKKVENILGNKEYPEDADKNLLTKETFDTLKAQLNDLSLSDGNVVSVTESLGNYFVDVEYKTSKMDSGSISSIASLVGLNGAFKEDYVTGEITKNDTYIQAVLSNMNKYFMLNGINKVVTYDDENLFQVNDGDPSASSNNTTMDEEVTPEDEDIIEDDTVDDASGTDGDIASLEKKEVPFVAAKQSDSTEEPSEDTTESNTENNVSNEKNESLDDILSDIKNRELKSNYNESEDNSRKVKFDIQYFNMISGSMASVGSIMPKLSTVYEIPDGNGTINGVAIYPTGNDGLKTFGYDRSKENDGSMTLRYTFKLDKDGNITGRNVYIKKYKADINIESSDDKTNIPEYVKTELSNTIERADRVIVDYDLPGMIQNRLFDDLGFGLLRGYLNDGARVIGCTSSIDQVIARDIDTNSYLVTVDTAFRVGSRSADSYATYKDKSYVVIKQKDTEFQITDWLPISKKIDREPEIDIDNSATKRLTALNLSGEVSNKQKKAAKELLNSLYKASTYRILNGPNEVETDDGTVTIEKGMYDCFDSDTALLSSDKKETMNSRLRDYLTGKGADIGAEYTGSISSWIGGSSKQVELIADEIVKYDGDNGGVHLTTYYLMSNTIDNWVIDEVKYLDSEEVKTSEAEKIYSRILKENK